jgi:uncharacterized protein with gpF-like domain
VKIIEKENNDMEFINEESIDLLSPNRRQMKNEGKYDNNVSYPSLKTRNKNPDKYPRGMNTNIKQNERNLDSSFKKS